MVFYPQLVNVTLLVIYIIWCFISIACNCYPAGTRSEAERDGALTCGERSGQCACNRQVFGKMCDTCEDGFWNIDSGRGELICYGQNYCKRYVSASKPYEARILIKDPCMSVVLSLQLH